MHPDHDSDITTEELLEAVLTSTLRNIELDEVCTEIGLPVLTLHSGEPVDIAEVHTFGEVGMLTLDRGVYLRLSDGSVFVLTIGVYRRPDTHSELHPSPRARRDLRHHP